MPGVPGSEQVGKSWTQHADWTGVIKAGLFRIQEQPRETHLGKFQRPASGRVFQYSQSCELRFADRSLYGVRSAGKPHFKRRADHFDANDLSTDSVGSEVHLVVPKGCLDVADVRGSLTRVMSASSMSVERGSGNGSG